MRSLAAIVFASLVTTSTVLGAPVALAAPIENHWDLARAVISRRDPDAAARIIAMLDGTPEEAARAARIMRVIGVGSPSAFVVLVARNDVGTAALRLIIADIAKMPAGSETRSRLLELVQSAELLAQRR